MSRMTERGLALPLWVDIPTRPAGVYAMAGDEVVCQRYHPVGRFARTVYYAEPASADSFQLVNGHYAQEGDTMPVCALCGGLAFNAWTKDGHVRVAAHFRDGWRK